MALKHKSWDFLEASDVVDVIAPASHSTAAKLEDGTAWLRAQGLIPRVQKNIMKPDAYFSAPLEIQLEHLTAALYSESKAIWCLRGGYGSMRLIPHLKKLRPPKKNKIFLGFSDITALHLFFTQRWNWPTIHCRNICQFSPTAAASADRELLRSVLFGETTTKTFKKLVPLNAAAKVPEEISAPITGGNLSLLQASIGTSWELEASGKILFIEDVAERGYRVERMLEHLTQAGVLQKKLKAIVFGDFTEGEEEDGKDYTLTALRRFAQKAPYPVLRGLAAGHGLETNYPVPFNLPAKLLTGPRGELQCRYF